MTAATAVVRTTVTSRVRTGRRVPVRVDCDLAATASAPTTPARTCTHTTPRLQPRRRVLACAALGLTAPFPARKAAS